MQQSTDLDSYLQEYLTVARSWNGLGEGMTVDQGLKRLNPITTQTSSPLLAKRARDLTREIILGRTHSNQYRRAI